MPCSATATSVSRSQAALRILHSLSYWAPSEPQTGAYTSSQSGHSQKAKSSLSTHTEWWLHVRREQGPFEPEE